MPESGKHPKHPDIVGAARQALLQAGKIQEAKVKLREISERTAKMVPPLNKPALTHFIRQTLETNASCKVYPEALRLCWTDLAEDAIREFAAENGWKVNIQVIAEFSKDE
ncbi:MAG: hypothetical protein ACAI37_09940 [Chthoniobacter sp.]